MKVHRLYFCNAARGAWDEAGLQAVCDAIGRDFESFTLSHAIGVFRGTRMPTLCAMIATDDTRRLRALARRLRAGLAQEGVGLEVDGHYERILD